MPHIDRILKNFDQALIEAVSQNPGGALGVVHVVAAKKLNAARLALAVRRPSIIRVLMSASTASSTIS